MVPSVALLSLLGAAALAGVHSAPVEKDDHVEEMVTRCIVEVLLNGLSKANVPPINPLCKELLKRTNRQKQEEENIGKDAELELRHLSESEELEKPPEGTVRGGGGGEEVNEEELKRQAEGSEKWHPEEKIHRGNVNPQAISRESPYSFDEAHKEEKNGDAEKRTEEEGSYKRNHQSEEESNEKKHSEELEPELLDKKSPPPAGRVAEGDLKPSGGQKYLEENAHSQEEGNPESKEEEDAEEEEEEESSEKYHHSFHREYEDSYERREPVAEKRGRRPRHYHRKSRLGNSSEYKRHHNGEKRDSPEESSEEESEFWDKRSHHPRHYYEVGHHFEEKRNSGEVHGSEETEGKNRGRWHHSREDNEGGDMRQRSRENEEKQHRYERRLHDEPQKELRRHYEERTLHSKASEEDIGKQHSYGIQDEKRHQHDKERQRLEWEELSKPQNLEKGDEEQRFYGPEERHNPGLEEPEMRRHSEGGRHEGNKRALLMEEGYPRSHYLVETVKRAVPPHIPYYQQLRWKGRHAEKKGGITDPFLESEEEEEEEPRSHPNERALFSEYNDYDSPWEKKQLMDGVSRKHNSNDPRFEVKRQYNRMDELAHLLSNRKKSAEFPELYSSKEDVKRGHAVRSGKGKLSQRPLTLEEEKELENLAAMDLELQKIAEKFNSNRRG